MQDRIPLSSLTRVIQSGAEIDVSQFLVPECPTVFVFYKSSSTLERDFASALEQNVAHKIGLNLFPLETGLEPIAQQFTITSTPTALVYDRRGRLVGRSSEVPEIASHIESARRVMRIDWAEEGDPRLDEVRATMSHRKQVPDILRTMSFRPDYAKGFVEMALPAQFTAGFLERRTKELIGTYASATNECKYCLGSHALGLQMQGMDNGCVDAVATLQIELAQLDEKELALLDYVQKLTLQPSQVRDTDTARLREVGWSDEQIFEASFITALFAFTNRMADAYGLDYPDGGWLPAALRTETSDNAEDAKSVAG